MNQENSKFIEPLSCHIDNFAHKKLSSNHFLSSLEFTYYLNKELKHANSELKR
jgi:hypothetical protein